MSASAFGLLAPSRDGQPLSLLVIMGATFPPPGVQVGFGFAISGVGGVVGINRRIDRDALMRAVTDGSAAHMLFPSDPVGAGPDAIRALPALFPVARGSMVAGPMFQLGWGGRVITMSVAVLVEAAMQARLTVMGKLVVALPDPEAPLVFLQATFAGFIDPAEPSVMFVASLNGSHIVGATVSGDMLLLTRGGSDPTLVLSAGGFHPAYRVPRGVPALNRMSMDMCSAPWIDLRCESYFAVTSRLLLRRPPTGHQGHRLAVHSRRRRLRLRLGRTPRHTQEPALQMDARARAPRRRANSRPPAGASKRSPQITAPSSAPASSRTPSRPWEPPTGESRPAGPTQTAASSDSNSPSSKSAGGQRSPAHSHPARQRSSATSTNTCATSTTTAPTPAASPKDASPQISSSAPERPGPGDEPKASPHLRVTTP
jgi:hypothetical protein